MQVPRTLSGASPHLTPVNIVQQNPTYHKTVEAVRVKDDAELSHRSASLSHSAVGSFE